MPRLLKTLQGFLKISCTHETMICRHAYDLELTTLSLPNKQATCSASTNIVLDHDDINKLNANGIPELIMSPVHAHELPQSCSCFMIVHSYYIG